MSRTNYYLVLTLILTSTFYACTEQEKLTLPNNQLSQKTFQADSSYTDQELRMVLDEEDSISNLIQLGRVVDISGIGMDVPKENPKKVYVHYMPWFQSLDHDGFWGQHWTMTNRDPEQIDEAGKREIASYYYPMIGPYSSSDPDLHEYHFLLMKMAGIDGVIFDWYGSRDLYDYTLIKQSTESFIDVIEDLGLHFSIMYEDRAAQHAVQNGLSANIIEAAQHDFRYINETYFTSPNYLTNDGNKLLSVFGPHYINEASQWDQVFSVFSDDEKPDFLTLWAAQNRVGGNSSGEFLWVAPDHLDAHRYYYQTYPKQDAITIGSVYPGFKSYYVDGGWSEGVNEWSIDLEEGRTFVETLNYTHHEIADMIQLITWNDFGEGTMIEPTEEFGFRYLQLLQQYTGVAYEAEDLQIALDLYLTRKKYEGNPMVQYYLDRTYQYIKTGRFNRVRYILNAINRFF